MEHLVRDNSQVVRSLLVFQHKQVTADVIQDLFKVQYSPTGSNNLRDEQAVIMHWYTFLQECDGMCVQKANGLLLMNCIFPWILAFGGQY